MILQPPTLTEGQGTLKFRAEQLGVFILHCKNAIRLATEVDPYHPDLIKSLRAAIEIKGLERVKGYIDIHCKEESVCFVLKDTANFIKENRNMSNSQIALRLNEIQENLAREVQTVYNLAPIKYHWADSDWSVFVQKVISGSVSNHK